MASPRAFVLGMAASWAVAGLVEPHIPDAGQPLNAVGAAQSIAMAVLVFCWVKTHARAQAITPPAGATILAALLPPIGIPYYAFRGFGFGKGAKLTGLALLTFIGLVLIYAVLYELSARIGA